MEIIVFHVQKPEIILEYMESLDFQKLVSYRPQLNIVFTQIICSCGPDCLHGLRDIEIVLLAGHH